MKVIRTTIMNENKDIEIMKDIQTISVAERDKSSKIIFKLFYNSEYTTLEGIIATLKEVDKLK